MSSFHDGNIQSSFLRHKVAMLIIEFHIFEFDGGGFVNWALRVASCISLLPQSVFVQSSLQSSSRLSLLRRMAGCSFQEFQWSVEVRSCEFIRRWSVDLIISPLTLPGAMSSRLASHSLKEVDRKENGISLAVSLFSCVLVGSPFTLDNAPSSGNRAVTGWPSGRA